jgi:hypothetical protein
VDDGGLVSYGPDLQEMYRRAATFVDRIWKGAKPGDLAIEQPDKLELVINLKTAKALGLTIAQSLRLRADECDSVIERSQLFAASGYSARSPSNLILLRRLLCRRPSAKGRSESTTHRR